MCIIICETDHQTRCDAWDKVLRVGALGWPWGMGWGGRWEWGSRWETQVHPCLIHVNVWQNPLLLLLKSLQSCPTLCDPIDSSTAGSSVYGILQARTLEWVAISFSKAWKWKVKVKSLSRIWLFVTLWTAAYEAPPSIGFPRQEYWSGLPLPSLAKPTTIL